MKNYIGTIAAVTMVMASGQALALETSVDRVGMVYTKIPLTKKFMRSNETAIGFRFGQTRFSTNHYGSNLVNSFKHNPAVVELEFRPAGQFGDIRFRLQEFKINGISSLEKQYITGGMGFVAVPAATAVLAGLGTVAAVGVMAAASRNSNDPGPANTSTTTTTNTSTMSPGGNNDPDQGMNDDMGNDDDHDGDENHGEDDNDNDGNHVEGGSDDDRN